MTKERKSYFEKRNIIWINTNNIFKNRATTKFYLLHPDYSLQKKYRELEAENVIFDIIRQNTLDAIQKIEIKHITREK